MDKNIIVVLGGGGKQGQSGILDLLRTSDALTIYGVDANPDATRQLQERAKGDSRLKIKNFDVGNKQSLLELLKEAAICINGLVYHCNIDIMEACLASNCHYIDYGGLYHVTKKQMLLNDAFKKKGLTAVIGMGSCPGTTNITARYAVDQLENVTAVHAICGVRSDDTQEFEPLFKPSYSIRTIMEEYTKPAVIFTDGEYREVEPASDLRYMLFPEIGGTWCFYILHSEVATYPKSWRANGIREASYRLGITRQTLNKTLLLRNLGFNRTTPLLINGKEAPSPVEYLEGLLAEQRTHQRLSDRALSTETNYVLRSHVIGTIDNKKIEYVIDTLVPGCPQWGLNSEELGTGTSAAIAAQMLLKGGISEAGVFPPEKIIPPNEYIREIENRFMPTRVSVISSLSDFVSNIGKGPQ